MKFFLFALSFFLIIGLNAEELTERGLTVNPKLEEVTILIDHAKVRAEVAREPREQAQGLMFRTRLGDNEGMIFCLPQEERASFWMKNVSLPLSVAYLDRNGVILEILNMKPFDETPIWSQTDKVYYALEMNEGWFVLNHILPGMKIQVEGRTLESLRKKK